MPSGWTKKSRGGDLRRAAVVGAVVGADDDAAGLVSSAASGGSGSALEGDNGLLSIIVPNMVKHSVPLCCALCCGDFFIPMLSAHRNLPRPRCCCSIFCNASGCCACKPCMPRPRTPIRLCASTKVLNSGKGAPSREVPHLCVRKPPRFCLPPAALATPLTPRLPLRT